MPAQISQIITIIGAGPVGLFAALALAHNSDYEVIVIEKNSLPIDKVCGQGILNKAVSLMSLLGIVVPQHQRYTFEGIRVFNLKFFKRLKINHFLLPIKGIGIERLTLSSIFLKKISQNPRISLIQNTRIMSIETHDKMLSLKDHNHKEFFCDFLLLVDGLNSSLRSFLANNKNLNFPKRMGARFHIAQSPWSKNVEVYFNGGIEAYITPVRDDLVEIAFLWYQEKISLPVLDLKEMLLRYFPQLIDRIDLSVSRDDFKVIGPFPKASQTLSLANKRIFFLGDSYFFADGITGEGLFMGFRQAWQLSLYFKLIRKQAYFKKLFYFYFWLQTKINYYIHFSKIKVVLWLDRI
jgi:2-polyprenyl-6-methoxyphenol hydroxylase-like FAD-dependent oxidoreductase